MQEEDRVRLVALTDEADRLRSAAEEAFASRDLIKPLVREREALKQQLSEVNSRVPRNSIEANQIERRIEDRNQEINRAIEPFSEFTEGVRSLVNQLKSALRFLPLSPGAQRLRKEIEKLPLLMRGVGADWTDARDDLLAIRMRLRKFVARSTQGSPSPRIEVPAGTKWENIHMRFLSPETIEIKTPDSRRHFNFAELGFEDRRRPGTETIAWAYLRLLAGVGDDQMARRAHKPAVVEKAVQSLRKRLKEMFGLGDDPFLPYHQVKRYAPKFKLSFRGHEEL